MATISPGALTAKGQKGKKKRVSKRHKYLGRTPGKSSRTGREVIARMRSEGLIRGYGKRMQFRASNKQWYNIRNADMAHRYDAVTYWNRTGRRFGPRSEQVRDWMLRSKNYVLDHFSLNRSEGAGLGQRYLSP